MNENIIRFYLEANKLKNTIRTGWKEVGIPTEQIESVAEHVYGSLVLTLGLMSEKDYSHLDLTKVFKMTIVKELVKAINSEQSVISTENKTQANKNAIESITRGLSIQNELLALYEEANAHETEEANFVRKVSKLESDIQAKKYELEGYFTVENARADVANYPAELATEILPQVNNASDGWLLFDRRYYEGDETFTNLSKDIQDLDSLETN